MVTIDSITAENIDSVNLVDIIGEFPHRNGNTTDPDYVVECIENGTAVMLLVAEDDTYLGYFLLATTINEHGENALLVWLANGLKPLSNDVIDVCLDVIKDYAKALNTLKVFFKTSRKGWQRRAARFSFKEVERTYELEW